MVAFLLCSNCAGSEERALETANHADHGGLRCLSAGGSWQLLSGISMKGFECIGRLSFCSWVRFWDELGSLHGIAGGGDGAAGVQATYRCLSDGLKRRKE